MKLYFVRHGKTEWNLEGRLQGAKGDSPLLKESVEQVRELGHYLSDTHFDLVFSSDLPRAKKTTELIMESQKPKAKVTYTKTLREWQLGKLEGQKISLIQAIYPKEMDAFRNNLANFRAKDFQAESVYKTTKRVAEFVKTLKDSDAKNVLIVGHGANLTASIRTLPLVLNLVFFVKQEVLTMLLSLFSKPTISSTSLLNVGMIRPIWMNKTRLAKSSTDFIRQAILIKGRFLALKKPLKPTTSRASLLLFPPS